MGSRQGVKVLLLTTSSHPDVALRYAHPNHGRLVQPRHYSSIEMTAHAGLPWAADNDAYNGWDGDAEERWLAMLERLAGLPGCLFVTAPDEVGDAETTALRYEEYAPWIMRYGLPSAFVAQDGLEQIGGPPWGAMDALFLGGSTDFKVGPYAEQLVAEARRRGKHVHMGRVNTAPRMRYAKSIGCDSVDGSQFSIWRATWLPTGLSWASAPAQLRMWP